MKSEEPRHEHRVAELVRLGAHAAVVDERLTAIYWTAGNHGKQRSGGGAVYREINVNSRRPLIPTVRREMILAVYLAIAIALAALLVRGISHMSKRSSAVKRRAAEVFAGRKRLNANQFSELFDDQLRSIAESIHRVLKNVLIVDVDYIRPEDRLVSDLGLGRVDGLEPYHFDADVKSTYSLTLMPLFERLNDPTVRDVIEYIANPNTTNQALQQ